MFHRNTANDNNNNTNLRMDDPLQHDSLDRGGEGDLRSFLPGQGPATGITGGHISTDQRAGVVAAQPVYQQQQSIVHQQQPIVHQQQPTYTSTSESSGWGSSRREDISRNENLGSVVSGSAIHSDLNTGNRDLRQSSDLDAPGASLGERLKNAVVQTMQDAQTGRVGNDLPPGHFEHATAHVKLRNTLGAESNPPDLLRDQDFEQRSRDHGHKRTNFELSDAGRVEILPTSMPSTHMGTSMMGVPAKEGYAGGVGQGHIDTTQSSATSWIPGMAGEHSHATVGRDRSVSDWDKSQQHSQYGSSTIGHETTTGYGTGETGYAASGVDQRHWTQKAADIIEDTKAKISETTHAAVNIAKGKGHSGSTGL